MNEESEYFEFEFDELKKRAEHVLSQIEAGAMPVMEDEEFEEIAEYFIENDEAGKGLKVCETALIQYPYNSALIILKADALLELDKIEEAEEIIDHANFLDMTDVNTYLIKSDIALYRNKTEEALCYLHEALEKCSEDLDSVYLQYADIYEETENFEEVFAWLQKVIEYNIDNEEAFQRIWFAADMIDAHERSIEFHKRMLDKHPYSSHAWYNISHAYTSLKRFDEAIDALEYVLAIDGDYDVAYLDIAELYLNKKDYRKALEYYLEGEHFFKHYKEVLFHIGLCYEQLNEMNKSRNYYRKALAVDGSCSETNYRLGRTYYKEDKIDSAIGYFEKAQKLNEESLKVLQALALSYNKKDDISAAIRVYKQMMELSPDNCYVWINLAINYFSGHEHKYAFELLETACIRFPENAEVYYTKFLLLYETGKKKAALTALARGLELDFDLKKIVFDINPDLINDQIVMNLVELYSDQNEN